MTSKKDDYPLEAVRKVRNQHVDEAQRNVAHHEGALQEARQHLSQAMRALEAHREETQRVQQTEGSGQPRSADELERGQAYLARRDDEGRSLEDSVTQAREAVRNAERAAERARAALGEAHTQHQAVETHHERWTDERRRDAEAREEQELEDRHRSEE